MACPQDYRPTPYLIDQVFLTFLLDEESTNVQSKLHIKPNPQATSPDALILNGVHSRAQAPA